MPITVDGIDLLGQPFKENTFTVSISYHGCAYSSKHQIPKNTWVMLAVSPSTPQSPSRVIRARVAWIQRPHSVRELFTISLEFEHPCNLWELGSLPEDWFRSNVASVSGEIEAEQETMEQTEEIVIEEDEERDFAAERPEREQHYEVALSFAGEDREYVEQTAEALKRKGVSTFYDKYEAATLWGKDLYAHLDYIYRERSKYTVMFISRHYATKLWTNRERKSAQARAFKESREYILPARFDDTKVPGILPTTGYVDLQSTTPSALADLIVQKLRSS